MPDNSRRDSFDGPGALGDLLREVTRSAGLNRSKPIHPVFEAWNEAVGPALAEVARPVRFRAGELAVDVASASHHHELVAFTGEPLRQRTNELLGEELVRRIAFKHNTHE